MWLITNILLSITFVSIVYLGFQELLGYLRLLHYRRQGIKSAKYDFWIFHIFKSLKDIRNGDLYRKSRTALMARDAKQPFYVKNEGSGCTLTLTSPEAAKEFFRIETDVAIKKMPFTIPYLGFFFENGPAAVEARNDFAKMFHYSNVVKLMPQLRSVIRRHVKALKNKVISTKDGRLKINIKKDVLEPMFDDMTAYILFTGSEDKIMEKFEGMSISQILKKLFLNITKYDMSLISKLPFAASLGLSAPVNEMRRLTSGFNKIIENEYKKKLEKADSNLADDSILEIMMRINKETKEKTGMPKYSMEDIGSNFQVFQFGASDTSYQSSSSNLLLLALPKHQEYQDRLREEIRTNLMEGRVTRDYNCDDISNLPYLQQIFCETIRLANPVIELPPRFAIKDFDLCGAKVLKGDKIRNFLVGFQPEFYENPMEYNPDRFNAENKQKIPYMKFRPFSHGKRNCIGKYFGELMVKLVISELLAVLKFEAKEDYQMKWGLCPMYGLLDAEVWVRLLKE